MKTKHLLEMTTTLLPVTSQYEWKKLEYTSEEDTSPIKRLKDLLFGTFFRRVITICVVFALLLVLAIVNQSPVSLHSSSVVSEEFGTDNLQEFLGVDTKGDDGFTIITPTFRREKFLSELLERYATGKVPSLKKIIIIWQDQETEPSQKLKNTMTNFKVPVLMRQSPTNTLNQRFAPDSRITTECVLSIDDDMLFEPLALEEGYQAWKRYGGRRKRMVGFVAREVTAEWKYSWDHLPTYSMVLTKAAYFHVDWLKGYWSDEFMSLRDYVDSNFNCEDILMSYIYARKTREPPLFLDAPFLDKGLSNGISTKPDHLQHRTNCVRHFSSSLGNDTLISNRLELKIRR